MTAFSVLSASFNVRYKIEYRYPYWLAVAGAVVLFISGCVGHIGRQMANSSWRFSISNLLFYFLCLSSTGLTAASTGLSTFGDSSIYCTITTLGLCTPFDPKTQIGLWEKCELDASGLNPNCTAWSKMEYEWAEYGWAVNFIFALFVMVNAGYRGISINFVCF